MKEITPKLTKGLRHVTRSLLLRRRSRKRGVHTSHWIWKVEGGLHLYGLIGCTDWHECQFGGDCIFRANKPYMGATYTPAAFFGQDSEMLIIKLIMMVNASSTIGGK